jgi:hypothetical protein
LTLEGLEPETPYTLEYATVDLAGRWQQGTLSLATLPAQPNVVINEVMANPRGPEPQQEWIELHNAGRAPINLEGFGLEDGGVLTLLPPVELGAGGYLVLTNEAYAPDPATDVPVEPEVMLRLPRLGRNGLANGGEPYTLRDPQGRAVSAFPALAANRPGSSLARVSPSGGDGPRNFAFHAEPFASPGRPNVTLSGSP